ncbi:MAG: DNA polymerase III subunit epsilon, partial [Rhodoferax sp.]
LCARLGVDNSGRTLHGALLDAELLADVYINLTRGQDALLMDASEPAPKAGIVVERIDLQSLDLPVLHANAQELAAHTEAMQQIDKASGGKAIWKEAA